MNPALKPCPDCDHEVSVRAAACPHCGAPISRRSLVRTVFVAIIAGLVFLGAVWAGTSVNRVLNSKQRQADAERTALELILNNLRLIEGAKDQFALEERMEKGATAPAENLKPYFKGVKLPDSVIGETYNIDLIGAAATARLPGNVKLGTYSPGSTVTLP